VDFTLGDHLLYPTEKSQPQLIMSTGKATLAASSRSLCLLTRALSSIVFWRKSPCSTLRTSPRQRTTYLRFSAPMIRVLLSAGMIFLEMTTQKTANNTADINDFKQESSEPEVRLSLKKLKFYCAPIILLVLHSSIFIVS
jgi:hypothetical protein